MAETLKHRGVGMGKPSEKTRKRVQKELKKKTPLMDVIVTVREVHTQQHLVKGVRSVEDAVQVVADGDCTNVTMLEDTFEYSHTLDPETWTTEIVKKGRK